MTDSRAKRSAVEPAVAILDRDPVLSPNAPRPGPIIGGTVLVLLRAVAAVIWGIGFVRTWPQTVDTLHLEGDPELAQIVLWVLLGFGAAWTLFLLLLARWLWRGSNVARLLVMLWSTVSISTAAVDYFVSGAEITVRTTLLTLALDILVMLALSSQGARAWARRPRHLKRQRKSLQGFTRG